MSPQFVDFDADGHMDIVAGTFAGSPFVALGSPNGFQQPTMILDGKGERIVLNQFWNYDTKKWDETTRCDPKGPKLERGHLTSAYAFDYDGDGDLDLLLGDYDGGYVFVRENAGKPGAPKFVSTNEPILIGKKPLRVGKTSTPRIVDWDGDGKPDLLVGSMGDAYGDGEGGGVFVFRNKGTAKAPKWADPVTLVEISRKGQAEATRPDSGLYMDLADLDGDGDLDLVVGGYSHWQEKGKEAARESFVWLYENRTAPPTTGAAPAKGQ